MKSLMDYFKLPGVLGTAGNYQPLTVPEIREFKTADPEGYTELVALAEKEMGVGA